MLGNIWKIFINKGFTYPDIQLSVLLAWLWDYPDKWGFSVYTIEPHLSGLFSYLDICLGTNWNILIETDSLIVIFSYLDSMLGNGGVQISEGPLYILSDRQLKWALWPWVPLVGHTDTYVYICCGTCTTHWHICLYLLCILWWHMCIFVVYFVMTQYICVYLLCILWWLNTYVYTCCVFCDDTSIVLNTLILSHVFTTQSFWF